MYTRQVENLKRWLKCISSLRVMMDVKLDEAEWVQARFDKLNLIEEKRLTAVCHGQLYQRRMKKAFD